MKKNKKLFPALKVPSGDNDIFEIMKEYIEIKKPILFSTGMMNMKMIKKLINRLNKQKILIKKIYV